VELHHGKISVESIVGKGSSFKVMLPIRKDCFEGDFIIEDPAAAEKTTESSDISFFGIPFETPVSPVRQKDENEDIITHEDDEKPLVLIVEDNEDLRAYIRSYLDHDFNVEEAIDGEQGLEKALLKIPDLILSDVMMPKMNGITLCQKLKTDERTSHIPSILLTARAAIEDRIEGLETGADDFISKPFDPQELVARIKNLIRQRIKLREYYQRSLTTDQETEEETPSLDQQFIIKARKVVNEKMTDFEFDVESFAGEMAMSRVQLHRKMRALLDQSASEFIRIMRLKHAAYLIRSKTGNITEVALTVGFTNLSYFAKCFHKQFGVNPSDYLNSISSSGSGK
jgi:DNA-binding response OmpR family regulator